MWSTTHVVEDEVLEAVGEEGDALDAFPQHPDLEASTGVGSGNKDRLVHELAILWPKCDFQSFPQGEHSRTVAYLRKRGAPRFQDGCNQGAAQIGNRHTCLEGALPQGHLNPDQDSADFGFGTFLQRLGESATGDLGTLAAKPGTPSAIRDCEHETVPTGSTGESILAIAIDMAGPGSSGGGVDPHG